MQLGGIVIMFLGMVQVTLPGTSLNDDRLSLKSVSVGWTGSP